MSLLLGFAIAFFALAPSNAYSSRKCVEVPDFCKNLTNGGSYMMMRVPNAFNDYNTNEVADDIRPWERLVSRCHSGLKLFLCTIYAPICLIGLPEDSKQTIEVCRSYCESVKSECEPVMKSFNYSWPDHSAFNCTQYVDDSMCVREDFAASPTGATTTRRPTAQGNDVICDPNVAPDVLVRKACSSDLVLRVEVTSKKEAKGDSSLFMLKIERYRKSGKTGSRSSRKTKPESLDRVFLSKDGCKNSGQSIKKGLTYLVVLEKRVGRKTKYMVKAILPWHKKFRKVMKRTGCRRL